MMLDRKTNLIIVRPRTWTDEMETQFPSLFRDLDRFGFAVDEGWREIITNLCMRLDALGLPNLQVLQVKEKFGLLRCYVRGGNEEVSALIRQAEEASSNTCEWCGSPGNQCNDGWVLTLCEPCQARRKIKKNTQQ